ncbi:hypothetical protein, partial [Sediminimonas qiaohouensis]|uniref:hypothetical protein n=1 Tax=Sediminimonas qiaohouensis TaxID=552061 RepID=UPI00056658B7
MTIDYKLLHLHATADDRYKSNRAQAFAEYMSPPSIDSMEDLLDVMSDCGLPVVKSAEEFLEAEDAEDEMETLMQQLECWAILMQAKLRGFRALQEEGFEAIKAEA